MARVHITHAFAYLLKRCKQLCCLKPQMISRCSADCVSGRPSRVQQARMLSFTSILCKRVLRDAIWHSDLGVTAVVTEAVCFT